MRGGATCGVGGGEVDEEEEEEEEEADSGSAVKVNSSISGIVHIHTVWSISILI